MGGSNGDGTWRGLVTIVELLDLRPYNFQVTVYGNLIYTVIYMSDRLLPQANSNPRLPPPPDLRRYDVVIIAHLEPYEEDDHTATRGKLEDVEALVVVGNAKNEELTSRVAALEEELQAGTYAPPLFALALHTLCDGVRLCEDCSLGPRRTRDNVWSRSIWPQDMRRTVPGSPGQNQQDQLGGVSLSVTKVAQVEQRSGQV